DRVADSVVRASLSAGGNSRTRPSAFLGLRSRLAFYRIRSHRPWTRVTNVAWRIMKPHSPEPARWLLLLGPLDTLHFLSPHPGPLPRGPRGEGESFALSGP